MINSGAFFARYLFHRFPERYTHWADFFLFADEWCIIIVISSLPFPCFTIFCYNSSVSNVKLKTRAFNHFIIYMDFVSIYDEVAVKRSSSDPSNYLSSALINNRAFFSRYIFPPLSRETYALSRLFIVCRWMMCYHRYQSSFDSP